MKSRNQHPLIRLAAALASILIVASGANPTLADAEDAIAGRGSGSPHAVRVEIFEGVSTDPSRVFEPESTSAPYRYQEPAFGFTRLPLKYGSGGIRIDRPVPVMVRATGAVELGAGQYELLLRGRNAARLKVDGAIALELGFIKKNADGHEEVPDLATPGPPGLRPLLAGQQEARSRIEIGPGRHEFVLEAIVGGNGLRPELGDLCVAIGEPDGMFYLLSPRERIPLTVRGWSDLAASQEARLDRLDTGNRWAAAALADADWNRRHAWARRVIDSMDAPEVPEGPAHFPANNEIDRFLNVRIAEAGAAPAPLTDDMAFLRRLSLDTVGVPPTPDQIRLFIQDPSAERRSAAIDRFLRDPGWADHWVGYWQDVLAENPGILKPMLNNTGPFRFWLWESIADNKSMDRFVSELIGMRGSVYNGGPAGFSLATQNDVPMAAKSQVVSQAFLAMNLSCARCHDAPYHEFKQEDLFSLAAMFQRGPQTVPATSSIPADSGIEVGRLVEVTLKPGTAVEPAWPFGHLFDGEVPDDLLRDPADTRERLAAWIAHPRNERFAQVMVNRLWKRYFGWGLVEPVDDWETATPSHPELLRWLGRQFVRNDYDWKSVAGLILNSHAYQRRSAGSEAAPPAPSKRLFEGPAHRRMSAEQVLDSLFAVAGKELDAEVLCLDVDGRRPVKTFLNLGQPERAWELTSLSNERDRPALAMPRAQSLVDVLKTFGWRESRQNPISVRDHEPNVLQPATLANGTVGEGRVTRLSDDSAITELSLSDQPLENLIHDVFIRILSRAPTDGETRVFSDLLRDGYESRRTMRSEADGPDRGTVHAVSWSNHLSPEATRIKLEMERQAREGDRPTLRLEPDWRERMEDMVWSLINTPEFIFIP